MVFCCFFEKLYCENRNIFNKNKKKKAFNKDLTDSCPNVQKSTGTTKVYCMKTVQHGGTGMKKEEDLKFRVFLLIKGLSLFSQPLHYHNIETFIGT
jgi:hypothetical protein